jgi:hypothetical protein
MPTIKRIEAQDRLMGGRPETAAGIKVALAAGIEFTNGHQPGERLKRPPQPVPQRR